MEIVKDNLNHARVCREVARRRSWFLGSCFLGFCIALVSMLAAFTLQPTKAYGVSAMLGAILPVIFKEFWRCPSCGFALAGRKSVPGTVWNPIFCPGCGVTFKPNVETVEGPEVHTGDRVSQHKRYAIAGWSVSLAALVCIIYVVPRFAKQLGFLLVTSLVLLWVVFTLVVFLVLGKTYAMRLLWRAAGSPVFVLPGLRPETAQELTEEGAFSV